MEKGRLTASFANEVSRQFVFERQQLGSWQALNVDYPLLSENARIQYIERAEGGIVQSLRAWLLDGHKQDVSKETTDIYYPATPWQFFKQLYAPKWYLRKWPVKNTIKRVVVAEHHHHMCPHVVVDNKADHFRWMARMSGQWPESDK